MADIGDLNSPIHASAVSIFGKGVLIVGASGSGKSSLALELLAFGGHLISDDRVLLTAENGELIATSPTTIKNQIEARGIGILSAKTVTGVNIEICVDMDKSETNRLPENRLIKFGDVSVPLILGHGNRHLAVAIIQYCKAGRIA